MTVIIKHLGYSESDQIYLEIKEVPLIIKISGGSLRMLPWNENIILDASNSYDPNVPKDRTNKLTFAWSCHLGVEESGTGFKAGGCSVDGSEAIESNQAIWVIPAKRVLLNTKLVFRVNVSSSDGVSRKGYTIQSVILQTGKVLKTMIR